MRFQELTVFAGKNISAGKYILAAFIVLQRGKLYQL